MRTVTRVHPDAEPASPGTRLRVGVLGGIALSSDGRAMVLPHRKARVILAVLALARGTPVSREQLADLLWDTADSPARGALRTTLYELRRVLQACGCTALEESGSLRLLPEQSDTDLARAMEAIAAGEVPAILAAQPNALGRILAGYEDISEGVRAWIDEIRASAQAELRRTIGAAMVGPAIPRQRRRALAQLALQIDPTDEAACRTVMRLAAEDGEIGVALKAYGQLYDALDAELAMEPADETQALVAAIKTGQVPSIRLRSGVPPQDTPPATALATLAVLPFAAASPDLALFADGVVEGTIHVLSGIGDLFVIARGTSMRYGGIGFDPREVGRELGVGYVMAGRVSRTASGVRVATELVATRSGIVVRTDRHEVAPSDLFALQDRIAELLVATLAPAVKEHELARARRKPPAEQTAYDLMLQGVDLQYALEESSYNNAGALLEEAIRRDPGFAPAHAHLATWHNFRIGQGWSHDRAADATAAERHAVLALDLDRNNAVALAIRGQVHSFHDRDYRLARKCLDRALEVGPSCVMAWTLSSATYGWTGNGADAVAHAARALSLSPRDPFAFFAEHMLSQGHYMAGDFDAAIAIGQRVEESNPRLTSNLRTLAAALVAHGAIDAARDVAARMLRLEPDFTLGGFAQRTPLADAVRAPYVARLRRAGLPG